MSAYSAVSVGACCALHFCHKCVVPAGLLPLLSVFVLCTVSRLAFFVPAGLLPLLSVFVLSHHTQ